MNQRLGIKYATSMIHNIKQGILRTCVLLGPVLLVIKAKALLRLARISIRLYFANRPIV